MSYESFKQEKSNLTRKEITDMFESRSWSVSGIHYFTKLIREREGDEQQSRADTIKDALISGGISSPDVVWGGEPDVIPDPGGDEKKDETKYFVKVYIQFDPEGNELISG